MPTHIHMTCDGCGDQVRTASIRKRFESVSGRSHGFGSWRMPDIDAVVADAAPGWMWSDPVTNCTYCAECAEEIFSNNARTETV